MTSPLATRELGRTRGPVLVLLHANGDSAASWPDAARRWGDDYRVVAVDARGHGASPWFSPDQLEEPGDVFIVDAIELLEEIAGDGGPVIGIGHSLGAGTLTGVLAARPGLLTGAVLVDPPWDTPLVHGPRPGVGAGWVEAVREYQRDPERALRDHAVDHPCWPADERAGWLEAKQSVDLDYLATGSGRPGTPWPRLVRDIADATLVVTGERDCLVGEATRAELDTIANSAIEVVVVPGAGHYVRQDQTDAFHAVVDPWLAERLHRGGGD